VDLIANRLHVEPGHHRVYKHTQGLGGPVPKTAWEEVISI
jgi:hypothetical protein